MFVFLNWPKATNTQPNAAQLKSSRNPFRMSYQINVSTSANLAQFRLKSQWQKHLVAHQSENWVAQAAYLPLALRAKCSREPPQQNASRLNPLSIYFPVAGSLILTHIYTRALIAYIYGSCTRVCTAGLEECAVWAKQLRLLFCFSTTLPAS